MRGIYTVGETIELKEKPQFSFAPSRQMRLAFTAIALVLALLVGGAYNYTTVQAAGYVTVDEGAGLELVLNRRNQVIEIRATDDTGETYREQLEEKHTRGASLEDALQEVNEIHRKDMKEKEPDKEPQDLKFRAVSDNEKHMEKLNKDLEQIRGKAKPAEESAPEMQMEESVSEEPHDAADSGHPEGMTGEKRLEGKEERGREGGMSPQP